jgi:hypothetical protein
MAACSPSFTVLGKETINWFHAAGIWDHCANRGVAKVTKFTMLHTDWSAADGYCLYEYDASIPSPSYTLTFNTLVQTENATDYPFSQRIW